ncbi:MAG: class I SAM-dependent methyltransferase [Woeseiaceae bacterium]
MNCSSKPLRDSPERSYAAKLERFAAFASPELRQIFADLPLPSSGVALDLGCGTGQATASLAEQLGSEVAVIGLDLSLPHLQAARRQHTPLVQCDAERLCCRKAAFDFIWSCNTINHLTDNVAGLRSLHRYLRDNGRMAFAQSGLLPDMFFAWDAPLDDAVRAACHRYYRERYELSVAATAGVRGILGLMHAADFRDIGIRTYALDRSQPLTAADRDYFQHVVFEGIWGQRIWPYLEPEEIEKLRHYCDPDSPDYCLDRRDFHHIQTISVCSGRK